MLHLCCGWWNPKLSCPKIQRQRLWRQIPTPHVRTPMYPGRVQLSDKLDIRVQWSLVVGHLFLLHHGRRSWQAQRQPDEREFFERLFFSLVESIGKCNDLSPCRLFIWRRYVSILCHLMKIVGPASKLRFWATVPHSFQWKWNIPVDEGTGPWSLKMLKVLWDFGPQG